ncbi:Uncharacterised protein [Mycobacterium tuberculosis]|nr:Uncharacterised protein [Mycobacterium tuberculosis]
MLRYGKVIRLFGPNVSITLRLSYCSGKKVVLCVERM